MKKFFYLSLVVLFAGAISFSACTSKPAAEEQETEVVEEVMEVEEVVETPAADSVEVAADSTAAM